MAKPKKQNKAKRDSIFLRIGGQAPKHLGPEHEGIWTVCSGMSVDWKNHKTIRSEGCPVYIDNPKELGTLEPRCPLCYRAYIELNK